MSLHKRDEHLDKIETFVLYCYCQLKVLSFIEVVIYRFNSIYIIIQFFLTFLVAAVGYSETADTERPKYL